MAGAPAAGATAVGAGVAVSRRSPRVAWLFDGDTSLIGSSWSRASLLSNSRGGDLGLADVLLGPDRGIRCSRIGRRASIPRHVVRLPTEGAAIAMVLIALPPGWADPSRTRIQTEPSGTSMRCASS
jgi:hypothetical protein